MVRCELVNPTTILTRARVMAGNWIFRDLVLATATTGAIIDFLGKRRLPRNAGVGQVCNIQRNITVHRAGIDGIMWRCPGCRSSKTIREDSFFSGNKLSLQIASFLYCWAKDWLMKDANIESGGMANQTRVDWSNFCRDVCKEWLRAHPHVIGGFTVDAAGNMAPVVMEIDESYFFPRKYNRGRWKDGHCVFGGVELGTGRGLLVEVPDRTRATLGALTQQCILPGTQVVSDGWAAYASIDQIGGGINSRDS